MSGPASEKPKENEERILVSTYPSVVPPILKTKSIAEYILSMVKENVKNGLTNWITDSVTGQNIHQQDVEPLSRSVASAFVRRGMVKGDAVLYLTSDVTRIYAAFIGVWRVGGVAHSSYPVDTHDTLHARLLECKAKWILCDPSSVPEVQKAVEQLAWSVEIFVFGEAESCTSVEELFSDDGEACPSCVPNPELSDPVIVLATSGTTGKSKGAIYTNITMLAFCFANGSLPRTEKPLMLLSRCTHVLGLVFPIRNACTAARVVMMNPISKVNIFACIEEYKPIFAFGFPTFLMLLALDPEAKKLDLSCLESVCTGGMMIPENFYDVMKTIPSVKHVMTGYGLTECAALATTVDLGSHDAFKAIPNHPPFTVGRLYPNTALKVRDLETGVFLGPREKGELIFKTPMMVSGYLNNPQDTKHTFVDGWIHTGDLGYYDEEGFIFVIDRIKDTFKYFNNHISPTELESEILRHPAVAEASVFGVKDPNGGDHIPRAVVILKKGVTVAADEIRNFANGRLAEYKELRGGLYIVESLPQGNTGKVLRSSLRNITFP